MRADINVTPLIDVLLVLLIVFMVITPLLSRGLPAAVPQLESRTDQTVREQSNIVLQVSNDGTLRLNGDQLSEDSIESSIRQVFRTRANKILFVKAESDLEYRQVARAIDHVRGADPSIHIGLMTPRNAT